ncbi:MAG: hypothetical protein KDC95_00790 [Planctomycetes bacterium]|nr:hypothetical protein [Planctomycetota bacterium]
MGDPARSREPRDDRTQPRVISLSDVKDRVQKQPFSYKMFTWAAFVYLCASALPWSPGQNGWSHTMVLLMSLSIACGLTLHVLGLQGIGPGGGKRFWRLYRYVVAFQAFVFVLTILTKIPLIGNWDVGLVLACFALPTMFYAVYRILDERGLLPVKITR